MIKIRSDDVITDDIKLKDYLKDAIDELSNDYIDYSKLNEFSKLDVLTLIIKHRNIILNINEICKKRNKY